MTTTPAPRVESIRERLTADHARLEESFVRVLRRLALDDRDETREAWNDFERGLTAHLDTEEALVLPAFALVRPKEAEAIRAEHERIRARVLELGVAVDLHTIRLTDASDLVRDLRDHAHREDALMYRWADENLSAAVRRAVVQGIYPRA